MRIADLNRTVTIQKLKSSVDFYGDSPEVETSFSTYAHVTDKGITETDGNGHVHEARELLITLRSYQKTRAIRPDLYQLIYMEELYDITHVELDSALDRFITLHARRKTHASHRPASPS